MKMNEKLLKNITEVMTDKLFNRKKILYNGLFLLNKYANINNPINKIIKNYNYLRIVASYMKGVELKLIKNNHREYINKIVEKMQRKITLVKDISDYVEMKLKYNIYNYRLDKLDIIREFYDYHKLGNGKKDNIFDLLDFRIFSSYMFNLLENYKVVRIIYSTDKLYRIDVEYENKYSNPIVLSIENKNFIQKILAIHLNKIIDILYDRQENEYYLKKFKLI